MEERLSMKQAAERLGASVDTIRRRLKKGELVGEKEPTPQGYEWRIVLPVDESDATMPERDAWRAQAQRSGEAERELRILLRQAQELALPAKATRQDGPGAPENSSPISGVMREEKGLLARIWAALRGGSTTIRP